MKRSKRTIIELLLFLVLIILDQITKYFAVILLKDKPPFEIITDVLQLYYLPNGNTGAAFGLLKGHQGLFLIIATVVCVIIGYILFNMPADKKFISLNLLLIFIAAGGVGNMIDRARQGFVVDFIYFKIIDFPIFNVADIYVSVCTVLLALMIIFKFKEEDIKEIEIAVIKPFKKEKK